MNPVDDFKIACPRCNALCNRSGDICDYDCGSFYCMDGFYQTARCRMRYFMRIKYGEDKESNWEGLGRT